MSAVNPTVSRVATSTTVATLLAQRGTRDAFCIFNESASILYVKFGAGASATDYTVQLPATTGYYESPVGHSYQGVVTGILAAGAGNAQVTDLA